MSWRTVVIDNGGKLSLQNNQLLIEQKAQKFTVPIEDLAIIIIQSRETIITAPLLSALAQAGVSLLTCDDQHLPCGQWLPFGQYCRPLQILKLQLGLSTVLKKQLWAEIIKRKILNQAFVLQAINSTKTAQRLTNLAMNMTSGDKRGFEAQAAMLYFPKIFGKKFTRKQENTINAHLNYAYAVLRSAMARALVQHGWLPQLGIFHHSEVNPFNLADDFIEPFRPIVDLKIYQIFQRGDLSDTLTPHTKQQLAALLNYDMQSEREIITVLSLINRMAASFKQSVVQKDAKLLQLPTMIPLKEHHYE